MWYETDLRPSHSLGVRRLNCGRLRVLSNMVPFFCITPKILFQIIFLHFRFRYFKFTPSEGSNIVRDTSLEQLSKKFFFY